jgi:hypothetical protein
MKTILLILTLILTFGLSAQTTPDTTSAGDELIKFEKKYSTGKIIVVLGTSISVTGSLIALPPVAIVGGVIALIGEVYSWDSHKHIRRAGKILNKIDGRKFILKESL